MHAHTCMHTHTRTQIAAMPPLNARSALAALAHPSDLWATTQLLAGTARSWLGAKPWGALREAWGNSTVSYLDLRAWGRIFATNSVPIADVWPGKFAK